MLSYRWPKHLLHKMDMHAKNFICSGDIHTKSLTMVQMHKMCKPTREGGIGLQGLWAFNQAGLMKLAREFMKKQKHWSLFMQSRFKYDGVLQKYYKSSSIWCRILDMLQQLTLDVFWNIGNNSQCKLWDDYWLSSETLIGLIPISQELVHTRHMNVGDFTVDGQF